MDSQENLYHCLVTRSGDDLSAPEQMDEPAVLGIHEPVSNSVDTFDLDVCHSLFHGTAAECKQEGEALVAALSGLGEGADVTPGMVRDFLAKTLPERGWSAPAPS
jgi:hypothetical protein